MGDQPFEDAKAKLVEINEVISGLDPTVRLAAFEILVPLCFNTSAPAHKRKHADDHEASPVSSQDRETFFSALTHDKPADNVHQVVAWLYSQYGVIEVAAKEIREIADEVGLTIPERADNTMRTAKKDGKTLYRQKNAGWQLTVHGEAHLKTTYSVRKGNKTRVENPTS